MPFSLYVIFDFACNLLCDNATQKEKRESSYYPSKRTTENIRVTESQTSEYRESQALVNQSEITEAKDLKYIKSEIIRTSLLMTKDLEDLRHNHGAGMELIKMMMKLLYFL